jgi:elongation factor G
LDPIAADGAFEFLNEVKDGAIPAEYIEPIVQGIRQSMLGGILFGCEVVNVRVTLFGGSYHEIDSNPTAFQIAASLAFKEAAHKSSPILLEPIMAVDIAISEAQLSAQVRDISSRRGRVESIELRPEFLAITAHIPLRETLHTSPNGRLKYPMRFLRYEELPSRFDDLGDDGLGVGVRNPKHPSTGQGSSAANPDPGRML